MWLSQLGLSEDISSPVEIGCSETLLYMLHHWCEKDIGDKYWKLKIKMEEMKVEISKLREKFKVFEGNHAWLKQKVLVFTMIIVVKILIICIILKWVVNRM